MSTERVRCRVGNEHPVPVVGGSIGPVLTAVILAGNTVLFQVGPNIFIKLYTENGYLVTWWSGSASP